MAKNNTIGICVTSIHRPSIHRTLRALATEARKRGYYLQIFAPLSDLYQKTKDDAAQKRIYNFVDFDKICCLILFTEMIKDAPVKKELYMRAMSADVPVISIKQPLSGSCNIKYDSETALANIIRHVIEVHGCHKLILWLARMIMMFQ